jgi:hypothetical protein
VCITAEYLLEIFCSITHCVWQHNQRELKACIEEVQ